MKEKIKKILENIRNWRFLYIALVIVLLFGVWVLFFDNFNLVDRFQKMSKLHELRETEKYYEQENLENSDGSLPSGCESYLNAWRILVQGPQFRYYLWNPLFNENEFDRTWRSKLKEWDEDRVKKPDAYQYSLKGSDRTLPGYFQEPAIFVPCVNKRGEVGIVNYKDQINGGTAQRHYIRGGNYMVVDSKGHIVKRGEADPTLDPECCGSCCDCNGKGDGLHHFGSDFSTQKGPVRM